MEHFFRLLLVFPWRCYLFDDARLPNVCVCKLQRPTEPPSAPLIASTRGSMKRAQAWNRKPPKSTPLQPNCSAHSFSSFFLPYLLLIPDVNAPSLPRVFFSLRSSRLAFASGLLVFITRVRWRRSDADQASREPAGGLINPLFAQIKGSKPRSSDRICLLKVETFLSFGGNSNSALKLEQL